MIIGVAFGGVVTALVEDVFTPLIAAVVGQPDLSAIGFTLNESRIEVGLLLSALLSFLIVASVVFFVIVMRVNRVTAHARTEPPSGAGAEGVPGVPDGRPGRSETLQPLHESARRVTDAD